MISDYYEYVTKKSQHYVILDLLPESQPTNKTLHSPMNNATSVLDAGSNMMHEDNKASITGIIVGVIAAAVALGESSLW